MRGHHTGLPGPPSPHVHSRQATLHAATRFCALLCRFIPDSYAKRLPKRSSQLRRTRFRSPRKPGRMRHAIGARPGSLTPSIHPKLGVKSRHQGLHRYALQRIFRPFLKTAVPTRILRRCLDILANLYSIFNSLSHRFYILFTVSVNIRHIRI